MVSKVTEFKGHNVLTLINSKWAKYNFTFGVANSKLVMNKIKKFTEGNQ